MKSILSLTNPSILTFFINVAAYIPLFLPYVSSAEISGCIWTVLFLADQYLAFISFSQIFGALGFCLSALFVPRLSQIEIVVVVLATISNLLLDALFIVGFSGDQRWAWATLLADGFYLLLSLRYILQKSWYVSAYKCKPSRAQGS